MSGVLQIPLTAWIQVALKKFVDDFATFAVEQDLLVKLETIFTPAKIFTISEDVIEDIAGETEESKMERESSTTKLATLKKALEVLKRLDRGQTQGHLSPQNMKLECISNICDRVNEDTDCLDLSCEILRSDTNHPWRQLNLDDNLYRKKRAALYPEERRQSVLEWLATSCDSGQTRKFRIWENAAQKVGD